MRSGGKKKEKLNGGITTIHLTQLIFEFCWYFVRLFGGDRVQYAWYTDTREASQQPSGTEGHFISTDVKKNNQKNALRAIFPEFHPCVAAGQCASSSALHPLASKATKPEARPPIWPLLSTVRGPTVRADAWTKVWPYVAYVADVQGKAVEGANTSRLVKRITGGRLMIVAGDIISSCPRPQIYKSRECDLFCDKGSFLHRRRLTRQLRAMLCVSFGSIFLNHLLLQKYLLNS